MSNDYRTAFMRQILGSDAAVSKSQDGQAVNISNEIASGVSLGMTFRPSNSTGRAVDLDINSERRIRHFDDWK